MKNKILLCALVFFAHTAWADTTLDIEEAVKMALENNLSLERSRMESLAAKRKYSRSWNSLIPSLSAGALTSRPTSITGDIPPDTAVWTPGFSLSASLQLSPSVITHIAQTREEYTAGRINYEAARQETEFQVRRLYYQILLLKENTELALQNIATAESRHEKISAQRRLGQVSNLDELSSRLDVQTQKTNALSAQALYDDALDSLKYLLMIPAEEKLIPKGELKTSSVIFSVIQKNSKKGGGESLRISFLRQAITALETQKKSAQVSSYAPLLNFSWNSSPLYSSKTSTWADNAGQFSISLTLKLDNYLPGSQAQENIDSLNDEVVKQRSVLLEEALNHQAAIQKLLRNIAQSEKTIETLRLNVTLAEENHTMYDEAYRRGAADLQNLHAARDSVYLAQNKLLAEEYTLISAILELEKELNAPFGSIGRFE